MNSIKIASRRREDLVDITSMVQNAVREASIKSGICFLYCPHTTAAVTVNEGADPSVATDMISGLARIVPESWDFKHAEGNSDAHIKASLVGPSISLLVEDGQLLLGTWQKIFFCEFDGPRNRSLFYKFISDQMENT